MLGNLPSESPSACYNGDGWCSQGGREERCWRMLCHWCRCVFSLSLCVFVGVSRSSWLLADASPPPALQPCSTAQHRSKSTDRTDTEGWVNVMSASLVLLYCVCVCVCGVGVTDNKRISMKRMRGNRCRDFDLISVFPLWFGMKYDISFPYMNITQDKHILLHVCV